MTTERVCSWCGRWRRWRRWRRRWRQWQGRAGRVGRAAGSGRRGVQMEEGDGDVGQVVEGVSRRHEADMYYHERVSMRRSREYRVRYRNRVSSIWTGNSLTRCSLTYYTVYYPSFYPSKQATHPPPRLTLPAPRHEAACALHISTALLSGDIRTTYLTYLTYLIPHTFRFPSLFPTPPPSHLTTEPTRIEYRIPTESPHPNLHNPLLLSSPLLSSLSLSIPTLHSSFPTSIQHAAIRVCPRGRPQSLTRVHTIPCSSSHFVPESHPTSYLRTPLAPIYSQSLYLYHSSNSLTHSLTRCSGALPR